MVLSIFALSISAVSAEDLSDVAIINDVQDTSIDLSSVQSDNANVDNSQNTKASDNYINDSDNSYSDLDSYVKRESDIRDLNNDDEITELADKQKNVVGASAGNNNIVGTSFVAEDIEIKATGKDGYSKWYESFITDYGPGDTFTIDVNIISSDMRGTTWTLYIDDVASEYTLSGAEHDPFEYFTYPYDLSFALDGIHTLQFKAGDGQNTYNSNILRFGVGDYDTTIEGTEGDINITDKDGNTGTIEGYTVGQTIPINVTYNNQTYGEHSFWLDGVYMGNHSAGTTWSISSYQYTDWTPTEEGVYRVQVTYQYEQNDPHVSNVLTFIVTQPKDDTTTTISVNPNPIELGQSTTVSITVKNGTNDVAGTVEIRVNGESYLNTSARSFEYTPSAIGQYVFKANYKGSTYYNPSNSTEASLTVTEPVSIPTVITINAPDAHSIYVDDVPYSISINLKDSGGNNLDDVYVNVEIQNLENPSVRYTDTLHVIDGVANVTGFPDQFFEYSRYNISATFTATDSYGGSSAEKVSIIYQEPVVYDVTTDGIEKVYGEEIPIEYTVNVINSTYERVLYNGEVKIVVVSVDDLDDDADNFNFGLYSGTVYNVSSSNGQGSLSLVSSQYPDKLNAGEYYIGYFVNLSGIISNWNMNTYASWGYLNVLPAPTQLALSESSDNSNFNQSITVYPGDAIYFKGLLNVSTGNQNQYELYVSTDQTTWTASSSSWTDNKTSISAPATVGTYYYKIGYVGNGNYESSNSSSVVVNVIQRMVDTTTTLVVNPGENNNTPSLATSTTIYSGDYVTLIPNLDPNTGNVKYLIKQDGSTISNEVLSNGYYSLQLTNEGTSAVTYTFTAEFEGNTTHSASGPASVSVTVLPDIPTLIDLENNTEYIVPGGSINLLVNVNETAGNSPMSSNQGTIKIYLNGSTTPLATISPSNTYTYASDTSISAGSHYISFEYSGFNGTNARYLPSDKRFDFTVLTGKPAVLTVNGTNELVALVGSTVHFVSECESNNGNGNVFCNNNSSAIGTIQANKKPLDYVGTVPGTFVYHAEHNGGVESNDVIVHWVNAIYQTTTEITISPDPGLVGGNVVISVNVKDTTNNEDVPAGDIIVYFEDVQKGTISNNGNINSDTLSTAKEYTVNAKYQGTTYNNNYYNVSEDTYKFTPIVSQPTTISIDASPNEILVDGSSVITVEVKSGNDIVSLGDVEIYVDGTPVTNISGRTYTFNETFSNKSGEYVISAKYLGYESSSQKYDESALSNTETITVVKNDVSISIEVGETVYPNHVSANITVNTTGTYKITFDSEQTQTLTLTAGENTVTSLDSLDAATGYTLNVVFDANRTHNGNSASATFNVTKAESTIHADNTEIQHGQIANVTYTVTGVTGDEVSVLGISKDGNTVSDCTVTVDKDNDVVRLGGLGVGTYSVRLQTVVDGNHTSAETTANVIVTPLVNLKIEAVVNPSNPKYGDQVTYTINVTNNGPDAATNVVVSGINASKWTSPSYSLETWNVGNLAAGETASLEITASINTLDSISHTFTVNSTENDSDVGDNTATTNVQAGKASSSVSADNVSVVYGNPISIKISSENATSVNYTVYDSNNNNITTVNGFDANGTISLSGLAAGEYTIKFDTNVDSDHVSSSYVSHFNVTKAQSQISVMGQDITYGNTETITVSIPISNATGTVTVNVTIAGETISKSEFVNGSSELSFDFGEQLNAGEYTVTAQLTGDPNYNDSAVAPNTFTVSPKGSDVSIEDASGVYGTVIEVNAVYENATGITAMVLNGSGVEVGTVVVDGTQIQISNLPAGEYTLSVSTVTDGVNVLSNTNTSKITVTQAASTISAEHLTVTYGDPINLVSTLENATGVHYVILSSGEAIREGDVDVDVDATGNSATINLDLGVGTYTVMLSTNVDENHSSASCTTGITVDSAPSKVIVTSNVTFDYGGNIPLSVEFENASSVTYLVMKAGQTITSGTISANNTDNPIDLGILDAGTYTVRLTTITDGNHQSVELISGLTVKKISSTVNGTSVVIPYGNPATVEIESENASSVEWIVMSAGNVIDHGTVAGNGSFTLYNLNAGTYTVMLTTVVDDDHESVYNESGITVSRAQSSVNASSVVVDYGNPISIVIKSENATAVDWIIMKAGSEVESGTSAANDTITLNENLAVGTYTIMVTSKTDSNHASAYNESGITVRSIASTVVANSTVVNYGEDAVLNVNFTNADSVSYVVMQAGQAVDGKSGTV
ncbi:Ig-like domain repeat protein, partial [uncultured Methanobrevibacter sp.]|uniref:Ig-like domain repeat protein n=1 Tax=uncultured Methanobrevibacter sp. TaxID=253161 RepID=UPI00263395F9